MPNSKSAKKRMRQTETRRIRNRAVRSTIKGQIRKVREATDSGNVETAETELRVLAKRVDKAAAKGIVHRNMAGRLKSRLTAAVLGIKKA